MRHVRWRQCDGTSVKKQAERTKARRVRAERNVKDLCRSALAGDHASSKLHGRALESIALITAICNRPARPSLALSASLAMKALYTFGSCDLACLELAIAGGAYCSMRVDRAAFLQTRSLPHLPHCSPPSPTSSRYISSCTLRAARVSPQPSMGG